MMKLPRWLKPQPIRPMDYATATLVPCLGDYHGLVHVMRSGDGSVELADLHGPGQAFWRSAENVYGHALCGAPVSRPYLRSGYTLAAPAIDPQLLSKPVCGSCEDLRRQVGAS